MLKLGLHNASGGDPGPQHILLCGYIVGVTKPIQILQVARKWWGGEGRSDRGEGGREGGREEEREGGREGKKGGGRAGEGSRQIGEGRQ